MDATMIATLVNFGFAAIAAYALWTMIRDLIPRLLTVIDQNSHALTESASALRQVISAQSEAATRLGRIDDRLLVLEQQHLRPVRECPFLEPSPEDEARVRSAAVEAFRAGRG